MQASKKNIELVLWKFSSPAVIGVPANVRWISHWNASNSQIRYLSDFRSRFIEVCWWFLLLLLIPSTKPRLKHQQPRFF